MDISAANEAQARFLAQKKQELGDEENALSVARAQAERQRLKDGAAEREKTDRSLVEISKVGAQQLETVQRMNSERVKSLSENQQRNYDSLAKDMAERLAAMNKHAAELIDAHAASQATKLLQVTERSEDPFYRIQSLNPVLTESESEYTIRVPIPEREAGNLLVAGEGQSVKLSLARRYQDRTDAPEGDRVTRTNSYMSIVENLLIPGAFDPKKVSKEYRDGAVVVRVPKVPKPTFIGNV